MAERHDVYSEVLKMEISSAWGSWCIRGLQDRVRVADLCQIGIQESPKLKSPKSIFGPHTCWKPVLPVQAMTVHVV